MFDPGHYEPVKSGKALQKIVRAIRDNILKGILKPGDKLPPEQKLMNLFGVTTFHYLFLYPA